MANISSKDLRTMGVRVLGEAPKRSRKYRPPKPRDFVEFSCKRESDRVTLTMPIMLVSEANQREHWTSKNKRRAEQQAVVGLCIGRAMPFPRRPLHITLTRLGPKTLDSDNMVGSPKHVRDALARAMGIDDGNTAAATWDVKQRAGEAYGVRVVIETRTIHG